MVIWLIEPFLGRIRHYACDASRFEHNDGVHMENNADVTCRKQALLMCYRPRDICSITLQYVCQNMVHLFMAAS